MPELSRDEIISVMGPLDDKVIAEIIGTRVTKEGLIEAHKRVLLDLAQHDPGPPLDPGPIARVIEILERIPQDKLLASPFSTGVRMG
jgi:hypothetical protein